MLLRPLSRNGNGALLRWVVFAGSDMSWLNPQTRHDILRKWFSLMTEHAEELARLIVGADAH